MEYFVGVDGGGTKTDFAVADATGKRLATLQAVGCSYREIGIEAAVKLVQQGIKDCLVAAGLTLQDCTAACLGMPCYGESVNSDPALAAALQKALTPLPLYIVNDVEIGWAGALECGAGIYLVAGTGAIAFGCDGHGTVARCGGWPEFFGDEGSCYWVGREALSLFAKQADGRVPKGALYTLVRKTFSLQKDEDFMEIALRDIVPHRARVAEFQRHACIAAQQGDTAAAALFQQAAAELAMLAAALKRRLLPQANVVRVSYGGGLFKADELILHPLQEKLQALGCALQPPRHTAIEGALLLAKQNRKERKLVCF